MIKNKLYIINKYFILSFCMCFCIFLISCKDDRNVEEQIQKVQNVLNEAKTMKLEELAKKSIEEINSTEFENDRKNGKLIFRGIGNSTYTSESFNSFINYLKRLSLDYDLTCVWDEKESDEIDAILKKNENKYQNEYSFVIADENYENDTLLSFVPNIWLYANNYDIDSYNDKLLLHTVNGKKQYLMIPNNSKLPWTACFYATFVSCTYDGYMAWGKNDGFISGNAEVEVEMKESFK